MLLVRTEQLRWMSFTEPP